MNTPYENIVLEHLAYLKFLAFHFTRNRTDADDLLQSTMERLMKNENNFELDTNFKAWSQTIMRNIFIDTYRKAKKRGEVEYTATDYTLTTPNQAVENIGLQNLNLAFLQKKIASLDEKIRLPFVLYLEGFHYEEIAKKLNVKIGTIKSRIFCARKKLKVQVKEIRF